jgi:hypothetical protein
MTADQQQLSLDIFNAEAMISRLPFRIGTEADPARRAILEARLTALRQFVANPTAG